jgi:hypothetical protein
VHGVRQCTGFAEEQGRSRCVLEATRRLAHATFIAPFRRCPVDQSE